MNDKACLYRAFIWAGFAARVDLFSRMIVKLLQKPRREGGRSALIHTWLLPTLTENSDRGQCSMSLVERGTTCLSLGCTIIGAHFMILN